MAVTTVAQLAAELNRPATTLLEQLKAAGLAKNSPQDSLTDQDKARLLEYLRSSHGNSNAPERKKITLTTKSTTEIKQTDSSGKARIIPVEMRKKRFFVKRDDVAAEISDATEQAVDTAAAELARQQAAAAEKAEQDRLEEVRRREAEAVAAAAAEEKARQEQVERQRLQEEAAEKKRLADQEAAQEAAKQQAAAAQRQDDARQKELDHQADREIRRQKAEQEARELSASRRMDMSATSRAPAAVNVETKVVAKPEEPKAIPVAEKPKESEKVGENSKPGVRVIKAADLEAEQKQRQAELERRRKAAEAEAAAIRAMMAAPRKVLTAKKAEEEKKVEAPVAAAAPGARGQQPQRGKTDRPAGAPGGSRPQDRSARPGGAGASRPW